jgi:S-layer protein
MAIASTVDLTTVSRLYTAFFNRAADTSGLSFWANALANGATVTTVTQGFLTAPEGAGNYPAFQSATDYVTSFYTKVFGRSPDAAGLAFWVAALNNQGGAASTAAKANLALQIISVVSTPLSAADAALPANAQTVADRALFANKVELSTYLATNSNVAVGGTNPPSTFAGVTATPSSIDTAKAGIFTTAITGTGNVIGTAGDNVFSAVLADAVKVRTIDGAAGNDTLIVTGVGAVTATTFDPATITSIETIKLGGVTGGTVNAAKFVGSTSIVIGAASSGAITLNNVTGKSVGFEGANTSTVTANYSATDTTAAVTLNGATDAGLTLVGALLASTSVTGSGVLTLVGTQPTTLKTVNVNSVAGSTIEVVATDATGVTTFDASASTGAVKATIGATAAYKGGSGVDTVTISAAPTKLLDGGAGTGDIIVIAANTDVLVASAGNITGFETLSIAGTFGSSYNAAPFSNILLASNSAASTFTNVAANTTLTISGAQGGATLTYTDVTGTADVLKLTISNAAQLAAGTVNAAGIETINITNTDTDTTVNAGANSVTLTDAALKTITVAGNTGLTVVATGSTAVTSFDATGLTISSATAAGATYTSLNATVGAAVSIKGALTGVNTLVGAAANDTIVGGAGADLITSGTGIDTLTGGAGNDTFTLAINANSSIFATITDATKGDMISLAAVSTGTLAPAAAGAFTQVALAAGTFAQFLAAASAGNGLATGIGSWFQSGGDTYVVVDNSAAATFVDGADFLVKLTGLVDLTKASVTAEVLTLG